MLHTAHCLRFGLLALALTAACQTTTKPQNEASQSRWVQATGSLEVELARQADALPYTHGRERVELISWFAAVGEPAYDLLLDFLDDDRAQVVATALAALGATGDARLVEPLRQAEQDSWGDALQLEMARARVRLGDWKAMPTLIEGLTSEEPFVRALCAQTITGATGETLGYDPHGNADGRAQAVERWRAWWLDRQDDDLLSKR